MACDYEAASGRVHGVETLLRWVHPRRGLVSPAALDRIAGWITARFARPRAAR